MKYNNKSFSSKQMYVVCFSYFNDAHENEVSKLVNKFSESINKELNCNYFGFDDQTDVFVSQLTESEADKLIIEINKNKHFDYIKKDKI